MNDKLAKAFNDQIQMEFHSAYLYLSMANYFEPLVFKGMAKWMRTQFHEEQEHAAKFMAFLHDRGTRVELQAIPAPQLDWSGPLDVFEQSHEHEQKVTASIHRLVEMALSEKDYASNAFLQWFVSEQVEEEATVAEIVDKLRKVGDNVAAQCMIDAQLGSRGA